MANKESIAQQVAQLSQEQQDKILKVGRISTTLQLIIAIPWILLSVLGLWTLHNPPLGFDYAEYDKMYHGWEIWNLSGAACIIGIYLFVKLKYPFYSEAKWKYIKKARKGK